MHHLRPSDVSVNSTRGNEDFDTGGSPVAQAPAPRHGRLSVLLRWNAQDPPSAFEQRRNERIDENWLGNRNPFVDHPEWAASIWG